jgi:Zn ribbon nucleic-acid-binding protein
MSTSRSRWLTWAPSASIIEKSPETPVPKMPKLISGTFGSASPRDFQKIDQPQATPAPQESRRAFPHCPRCASYALYRKNNVGIFECLTCGLEEITESTARRPIPERAARRVQ